MTALGLIAGLLTTICWVPQLARSLRTRSTGDLSWAYLLVMTTGVTLWMIYGVLRLDLAITVSNLFGLACLCTLIVIKSGPRRPPPGRVAGHVAGDRRSDLREEAA